MTLTASFEISLEQSCMCICRYGPFWVTTTLIFVIAATGNYANYVSYRKKHASTSGDVAAWYSNVDKVRRAGPAKSLVAHDVFLLVHAANVADLEALLILHTAATISQAGL